MRTRTRSGEAFSGWVRNFVRQSHVFHSSIRKKDKKEREKLKRKAMKPQIIPLSHFFRITLISNVISRLKRLAGSGLS